MDHLPFGRYRIIVQCQGDGPPPEVRLRRLLKIILRGYWQRCVSIMADDTGPGTSLATRSTRTADVGRPSPGETAAGPIKPTLSAS